MNSKVSSVVRIYRIKLSYDYTDTIFLIFSHSYFKTYLYYYLFVETIIVVKLASQVFTVLLIIVFYLYILILQCMLISLVIIDIVKLFYYLSIVDHKFHCFINPFHHCREYRVKRSCLIQLNKCFLQFDWLHILNFTIHTSRHAYIILFLKEFTFLLKVLLWSHTLCCWNNHCHKVASQVIKFILIQ